MNTSLNARNVRGVRLVRPTLRVDYRLGRRLRFELESGYERSSREMADRDLDMTGFFIRAGYRASL